MIGGCLSNSWQAWQARDVDSWVVEVLREGYRVPFVSLPQLSQVPVALGAYSPGSVRGEALEGEIRALQQKGAVELAPSSPGFYSRMFVVPKATGGWRPIIDLSTLNLSVVKTKFRMETVQSVLRFV